MVTKPLLGITLAMTININSTLKNEKLINTNDKASPQIKSLSLSTEIRKATNIGGYKTDKPNYQKQYFAMPTCHFEPCEQREVNQLKYSPPVEKITLPYKYHEKIETHDQFLILKAPRIFNHTVSRKNDSFTSKKQDTELMSIDKISTPETKTFKDFHLNRSASRFSNLILELKSTHEKSIRYLKNKFNKNNNEEPCVKFEIGKTKIIDKAAIAKKSLIKQHEKINDAKATSNIIYTTQQQKLDLCNNYKILLDEINIVESKANVLIMESSKDENQSKYHELFEESNIIDMINSSELTNCRLKEINDIFNEMKSVIKMLEDYIDESESNEKLAWDDYDINSHSLSNETPNTQNKKTIKQDSSQYIIDNAIHIINKLNLDIISENTKNELNEFFNDNRQSSTSNLYSSNESLSSDSSAYHSDSNFFSSSSKYSSTESLYQEKDNKENSSDIHKSSKKQIQTEKMKLLTKGNSSTGYIYPSRRAQASRPTNDQILEKLDKEIARLTRQKEENQQIVDIFGDAETQVNQLISEAKKNI